MQKSGAKSPHSKALCAKFPNTRILFRRSFGSACASLHRFLCSAKDIAQFVFSVFENTFSCLRQIFTGAIDVEIQHRHCRLKVCPCAAYSVLRSFNERAILRGSFDLKTSCSRSSASLCFVTFADHLRLLWPAVAFDEGGFERVALLRDRFIPGRYTGVPMRVALTNSSV